MPVIVLGISGITGCFGGGGGGSPQPGSITYTGNINPAPVTADNANILMADIVSGPSVPGITPSGEVATPNSSHAPFLADVFQALSSGTWQNALPDTQRQLPPFNTILPSAVAINETQNCATSGTTTSSGNIDQDGTGTLTLTFTNCDDGTGITLNGIATVRVDAFDLSISELLDFTLQSGALNIKDAGSDMTFNGTMRGQLSLNDNRETLTINGVVKDNLSTRLLKYENLVIISIYDNYLNPASHTESYTGRLYDSVEGYVDITTGSSMSYSNEQLKFPDGGGPLVITGAEGSRAVLLALSSTRARIEIDTDGDSTYETASVYLWTDLAGMPAPNEPPVGTVILSPTDPGTGDTLMTTVTASDPDGDPLSFAYAWTRNGSAVAAAQSDTLGADQHAKGDTVAVTVTISDGTLSATATDSITIADTPPAFNTVAPLDAVYGSPVSFQARAIDVDDDPIVYALAYGPAGMLVNSATGWISWTPSGPMFDEALDVHFGVRASADGVSVEAAGMITVTDTGHARPMVRSGLRLPSRADSIFGADFNGDGKAEILLTDNASLLYTLVYDGADYAQDWVYPFDLDPGQSITAIAGHDLSGDGRPDMLIGAGTGIIILDGISRKEIGMIEDGYIGHYSIHVADIDNDGNLEIIYLGTDVNYSSTQLTINVYDASTLLQEWQSPVLDLGNSLAVGNVDNDPALEIVTANGYVYDGTTHANEWSYGPGFGFTVDTGDLDTDGVEEIVGLVDGHAVRTYSGTLKSPLWEISISDVDALLVANTDNDPQAEILVGDGQWGNVTAYDGISHAMDWSIDSGNHGVSSITIGDTDNDGKLEIVWATGYSSSGPDSLLVTGFNPDIGIEWTNGTSNDWAGGTLLQLDGPFIGGRWLTTAPGQSRAVFASVSSNNAYDGTRLVGIDTSMGGMILSSEVGSNWSSAAALDGADYDGDSIDEVFLGTATLYDGYATVYDFSADLAEWTSATGIGTARAVKHGDLDGDSQDDLVLLTSQGYVRAYSPGASTLLWMSTQLPGFNGSDVEVADLDGDGLLEITASSSDGISVYERQGLTYIQRQLISLPSANQLAIGDVDGDGHSEIIAAMSDFGSTSTSMHVYDGQGFQSKAQYNIPGVVTDLAVSPDDGGNLLVATASDSYLATSSVFTLIDATSGQTIWASPQLIGQVQQNSASFADTDNDGINELIFGTSRAMYITR